jgi:hypothetical protein
MRTVHLEARRVDADNRYLVSGGSRDHIVEQRDGRCFCDCADASFGAGDECKHSLLVRLLGGDRDVVKALRRIVPGQLTVRDAA